MPARSPATWAGTFPAIRTSSSRTSPAPAASTPPTTSTTWRPKDGTVFGTFGRGLAMEPLIGTARVQFDATKFTWLGSGTNEISLCATWHTSPVKTWQDALKTQFTVGGEGAGSDPDTYRRVRAQRVRRQAASSSPAITAPPTSSWRSSAARSTAAAAGRGRASSRRGRPGFRRRSSTTSSTCRRRRRRNCRTSR